MVSFIKGRQREEELSTTIHHLCLDFDQLESNHTISHARAANQFQNIQRVQANHGRELIAIRSSNSHYETPRSRENHRMSTFGNHRYLDNYNRHFDTN